MIRITREGNVKSSVAKGIFFCCKDSVAALSPVLFGASLVDWIEHIISSVYSVLAWLVSLPAAWDLIQVLLGLSFFGWLGFVRLNDDEVRRVPKKKKPVARDNLRLLGNYFFVSFTFFIVCVGADYLIHNVGLLGAFFEVQQATPFLVLTVVTTGLFGLALIVVPMLVVRGIGQRGKGLGDISLPSVGLVFSLTIPAAINVIILLYLLPHLSGLMYGGQWVLVADAVSWLGTYVNWKYWDSGRLITVLAILQFAGAIVYILGVIFNWPLFVGPSTFQTVARVVTITTTTTATPA